MDFGRFDKYINGAFPCFDKLPENQRSYGFVVQTLIIGIGTWIASNLPWFVSELGVSDAAPQGVIPASVKLAFAIGAGVFTNHIVYGIYHF